MAVHEIDPQAVLDYQIDWRADNWLAVGETITSHTCTATTGITVDHSLEAGGVVTVWVKNGVAGTAPVVTCHVVTNAGREEDKSLTFVVRDH